MKLIGAMVVRRTINNTNMGTRRHGNCGAKELPGRIPKTIIFR